MLYTDDRLEFTHKYSHYVSLSQRKNSEPKIFIQLVLAKLKFCPVVVLAHLNTKNLNFMLLLVRIVSH